MDKVVKILLIEEDKPHQIQIKHVLDKKGILYRMRIDVNGKDALNFLENDSHTEFHGNPDIILLDIDPRRTNGMEFLSELRKEIKWSRIKVFVLSSSDEERERMSQVGVAGYYEASQVEQPFPRYYFFPDRFDEHLRIPPTLRVPPGIVYPNDRLPLPEPACTGKL
jgi:CheY-like chemotaxis protein